ncbi:MAG: heavy metal translocating P-type ATPase metal-binding domain-containing protein [Ignavibacteriaceae bacterium]
MTVSKHIDLNLKCYHCGENCRDTSIIIDDKVFCCTGCKMVYQILNENQLDAYYSISETPGITQAENKANRFEYLDDVHIQQKLIDFKDEKITSVTFYIPQMHCSSCIWLLENLFKLNASIVSSRVNFLKKQLSVKFLNEKITLKVLVMLITAIGYEPQIHLDAVEEKKEESSNKNLYLKLGVAGFCFGNIMLLSFPEYLSIDVSDSFYKSVFAYLNLFLSLPVLLYSSLEYFSSAYKGLKRKIVNLDVPISLGIIVLFGRTAFEILTNTGAGYADSFSGLVFFLLIGKLFQSKTYDSLNFERNYKSYFPLAVIVKKENEETSVPVSNLEVGDRIIIRHNEIIPADSILFNGEGKIDYSFVTGESTPVPKVSGELIYAGGRQLGGAVELEVIKEVSQSYLTQLWNNDTFNKPSESSFTQFSNTVSKYFTGAVLLIAVVAALLWLPDLHTAMDVFTAVLIVACPCALALSTPFTLGNTLRIFGRNKFYVKNTQAIEDLAKINSIVFDKTGTITETGTAKIEFVGIPLNNFQKEMVKSLTRNSIHPLSKAICYSIDATQLLDVVSFKEIQGEGIEGMIYGNKIKLGSEAHLQTKSAGNSVFEDVTDNKLSTKVYLSINEELFGYFRFTSTYRAGVEKVISHLNRDYELTVLSGDNEGEKDNLLKFFPENSKLFFRQTPADKLNYVASLQAEGKKVLMVGDGLNDAGALSKSNVGIAVTEDISNFSPACDIIMESSVINKLAEFIRFSGTSVRIIKWSFVISFAYNIIGLSFAVEAMLTPIIAAILMPLSSITMVAYTSLAVNFFAKRRKL